MAMQGRHVLRRKDRHMAAPISDGDHNILAIYARLRRTTQVDCLHDMIGTAAKCWEEKHDDAIKDLNERLKIAEDVAQDFAVDILAYRSILLDIVRYRRRRR